MGQGKHRLLGARGAALPSVATFALAGCVVEANMSASASSSAGTGSGGGIAVAGPPPPPVQETAPPPPAGPSVWIPGYWHWTGMRYSWIPGHWEHAQPGGAAWHPPRYWSSEGTYFYEPGAWGQSRP